MRIQKSQLVKMFWSQDLRREERELKFPDSSLSSFSPPLTWRSTRSLSQTSAVKTNSWCTDLPNSSVYPIQMKGIIKYLSIYYISFQVKTLRFSCNPKQSGDHWLQVDIFLGLVRSWMREFLQ